MRYLRKPIPVLFCALAASVQLSIFSASAGDAVWNGSTDSWSNATLWTSVPADNYPKNGNAGELWNATITSGNAILDAEDITIQTLTMTGGTLSGSFNITLNAGGAFNGATMSGTGTTTIGSSAVLTMDAPGDRNINNRLFVNNGTVNWGDAKIFLASTTFTNNGILHVSGDDSFESGGGISAINNTGTFTKDTGTGTTTVALAVAFNNTGAVNVNSGSLVVHGGTSSGSFN